MTVTSRSRASIWVAHEVSVASSLSAAASSQNSLSSFPSRKALFQGLVMRLAAVMQRRVFFAVFVSFQKSLPAAISSSSLMRASWASTSKIPPQVSYSFAEIVNTGYFHCFGHIFPFVAVGLNCRRHPGGQYFTGLYSLRHKIRYGHPVSGIPFCQKPVFYLSFLGGGEAGTGTRCNAISCGCHSVNPQYVVYFCEKIVLTWSDNHHIFYYCLRGDHTHPARSLVP